MTYPEHTFKPVGGVRERVARVGAVIAVALALIALSATPALADLEQVANFSETGEGSNQLEGYYGGLAVNVNGSGAVPPGTVYAADGGLANHVVRYGPEGEFLEAWGWKVSVHGTEQFERCGPDGEPAHPHCTAGLEGDRGSEGEGAGQFRRPIAVAVNQTTGYVYVLNAVDAIGQSRKHNLVEVFSPDGSQLIAAFGDAGAAGEGIEQGPDKFHEGIANGLAVDSAGTVYVSDFAGQEERIMTFKPQSPGNYEHYVYAGRANDIATGAAHLAVDDMGNLYTAIGDEVLVFAPADRVVPLCRFEVTDRGLNEFAVDPASGAIYFWDEKTPKVIRHLAACNGLAGFEEQSPFTMSPRPKSFVQALAFNPSFEWPGSRPAGVLYGVDAYQGLGYIFARAAVRSPAIGSESVSAVTSTTATLGGTIDTRGSDTHYVFQYIARAAYEANGAAERFAGAAEAPFGGADLPPAQQGSSVAVELTGLSPETDYRFRLLATSYCDPANPETLCEAKGEEATFRTFPVMRPGLADGRAWERVSPALKNGGEVFPLDPSDGSGERCKGSIGCQPGYNATVFPKQSSPDGDAVVYEGFPFSSTEGAPRYNEYLSKRTANGWKTTVLTPALLSGEGAGRYTAFSPALTQDVLFQETPALSPDAPSDYPNLYTQSVADPSALSPLITEPPPNRAPGATGANRLQIRYAGASEDYSHQFFAANDALTGETAYAPAPADEGPAKNNLYEAVGGQLRLVNVLPGNTETAPGAQFGGQYPTDTPEAIAADGSRVFWSYENRLYAREGGQTTIEIPDPGRFLAASRDGNRVLLSDGHIYDLEARATVDLTDGQNGFQGMAGSSEDLSYLYFVDTAVLSGSGENQYGASAQAGQDNLYAWHEGKTEFIAALAPDDNVGNSGDWFASSLRRTAEASPAGRWFAFLSVAPLTGYDNRCGVNDHRCPEAFLYDSTSRTLVCASCNRSGARPLGPAILPLAATVTGDPTPQPRYVTDTGRLYFDSQDALSLSDTNMGAEDVYEYEPGGLGDCEGGAGCVSLMSAGREGSDSNFLAIDATGKDVFFTTRDQLVPKDTDELVDLYDAREGGGIPGDREPVGGGCAGEACQAAQSPPPDSTPGSLTFQGAENSLAKTSGEGRQKAPALTRAQKLARALRLCARKAKRKRAACRAQVRRHYTMKARKANINDGGKTR